MRVFGVQKEFVGFGSLRGLEISGRLGLEGFSLGFRDLWFRNARILGSGLNPESI